MGYVEVINDKFIFDEEKPCVEPNNKPLTEQLF